MPQKSKLGQNFLRDQQAIHRIVAALGDISNRTVVEIGPGRGAITELLATRAGHLIAIELDPVLAADLQSRFTPANGFPNFKLLRQDVLTVDFSALAHDAGQPLLVVGNLPYYITSPILTRLADAASSIDLAVLMVQREVADRVTASPGSSDYGLLSTTVQLYGQANPLFTLPPQAFSPPPEVHSTVFRWVFAPRFGTLGVPRDPFVSFLKACFAQKRKTLSNNLRNVGHTSQAIADALFHTGLSPQARAEELTLDHFAALFRALNA